MQTQRFLTRSTLTLAALSAFVLAQPAHAGLLGISGSLVGGIGSGPLSANGRADSSATARIRPAALPQRPALQPAGTVQNAEGRLTEGLAAGRERGAATAETAADAAASRAATVHDRASALRERGESASLSLPALTGAAAGNAQGGASLGQPAIAPQAGATAEPKASASGSRSNSQANGSTSAKARAEPGSTAAQADAKADVSAERRSGN